MRGAIFFGVLFLLFVPFVSSTILFSDLPKETYSVGDLFHVNFSIESLKATDGFVEASLNCSDKDLVFHKDYYFFEKNVKRNFSFSFPLSFEGNCFVEATFDGDLGHSSEFTIGNGVDISYDVNNLFFLPSEKIVINGSAIKFNGEPLKGVVVVSIEGVVEKSIEVTNGNFVFSFVFDQTVLPREYSLQIDAFEKNSDGVVINQGSLSDKIEVKSKATFINFSLDESVKPPKNISFGLNLLDQGENLVKNQSVLLKIFDPVNNLVLEKQVSSNGSIDYFFASDSLRGGWRFNAYYGNLSFSKTVFVEDNPEVNISFFENKVIIKNVGNVLYEGPVNFSLENSSFEKNLLFNVNLLPGEVKEYPLDVVGDYNVTGEDGNYSGFVSITGNAVVVDGDFDVTSYVLSFFLLFLFLVFVGYLLFRKNFLKSSFKKSGEVVKSNFSSIKNVHSESKKSLGIFSKGSSLKSSSDKKYFIIFVHSSNYFDVVERFVKKYGFTIKKLNGSLGYVVKIYSGKSDASRILKFAKEIKRFMDLKKSVVSIVLHSDSFPNKLSNLKQFASFARELIPFSKGRILATKGFFENLGDVFSDERIVVGQGSSEVEVHFFD